MRRVLVAAVLVGAVALARLATRYAPDGHGLTRHDA